MKQRPSSLIQCRLVQILLNGNVLNSAMPLILNKVEGNASSVMDNDEKDSTPKWQIEKSDVNQQLEINCAPENEQLSP